MNQRIIVVRKATMKRIFWKLALYADTDSWPAWSVISGEVITKAELKRRKLKSLTKSYEDL